MTANQINYAKHSEERRHNLVAEELEREKNLTAQHQADTARYQAKVSKRVADETERANREREAYNWWYGGQTIAETTRHNMEAENVNRSSLAESIRHNQVTESVAEKDYLSMAKLRETQGTASLMQAKASQTSAAAAYRSSTAALQQAQVSQTRADTERSQLAELIRHNSITENEIARHNEQTELINSVQASAASTRAEAAKQQASVSERQIALQENRANLEKFNTFTGAMRNVSGSLRDVQSASSGLASTILGIMR